MKIILKVTQMKIEANRLADFCSKINRNGDVNEVNLEVKEEGVSARAASTDNVSMVDGKLSSGAFKEFNEDFGNVPVPNLEKFIDILEVFGDEVVKLEQIERDDFKLVALRSQHRTATVPSGDEELVGKAPDQDFDEDDFDGELVVDYSLLKTVKNNVSTVGTGEVVIKGTDNGLAFITKNGDDGSRIEEKIDEEVEGFDKVIINASKVEKTVKTLTEEKVKIMLGSEFPIRVIESEKGKKTFQVQHTIAPIRREE